MRERGEGEVGGEAVKRAQAESGVQGSNMPGKEENPESTQARTFTEQESDFWASQL